MPLPEIPENLFIEINYPSLGTEDQKWERVINGLVRVFRERREMKGSLVYRPDVTKDDPANTRLYELTDPRDFQILRDNNTITAFTKKAGILSNGNSMTLCAWTPPRPVCRLTIEQYMRTSRWRTDVFVASRKAQLPAELRKPMTLRIREEDVSLPEQRQSRKRLAQSQDLDVTIITKRARKNHLNPETPPVAVIEPCNQFPVYIDCLPSRFPPQFMPTELALRTPEGWISCFRKLALHVDEADADRVHVKCECMPGRGTEWMPCDGPNLWELITLPLYPSPFLPIYLKGYMGTMDLQFIEVYPFDVVDKNPPVSEVADLLTPPTTNSSSGSPCSL